MPRVTYIVSAFDRPNCLPCVLWSLKVQTDPDFEVIVADNALTPGLQILHTYLVNSLQDSRFRHVNTAQHKSSPAWDCYWSAEWIVEHEAKGEWICLPSDDSYYVPIFQEAMLAKARTHSLKLVYCEMLYDRRIGGIYSPLDVQPVPCRIDKTGFMLRRDVWIGFPNKPTEGPASSICDGLMIHDLVTRGVRHAKVEEILCVHN